MLVDEVVLRAACAELSGALAGARVEKAFQPLDDLVLLELYPSPDKKLLALSCDGTYGFLGLVGRKPPNPPSPPAFCGLLRKRLGGARLEAIEPRPGDRVVRLRFLRRRGEETFRSTLELRLLGARANLVLYGDVDEPVGKLCSRSHHRGALAADPDVQPLPAPPACTVPGLDELCGLLADPALDARELARRVPGLPPRLAELARGAPEGAEARARWLRDTLAAPAATAPAAVTLPGARHPLLVLTLPPQLPPGATAVPFPDLTRAMEACFFEPGLAARVDRLRAEVGRAIEAGSRRLAARRTSLEQGVAATGRGDRLTHEGELLKANLGRIPRGAASVTVDDWETGAPATLALDPAVPLQRHLQRLFDRARKARRALPILRGQLAETSASQELLAKLATGAAQASSPEELELLRAELQSLGLLRASGARRSATPAGPARTARPREFLRFTSSDGLAILVGRNGAENDRLSLKVARAHDLWLHAKEAAGAHVVVRLKPGQACPPATVQEAAQLAAHFSKRRHDTRADVLRARAGEVRKPHGAPPGSVTVRHGDVLAVRPDPSVATRLVAARHDDGGDGDAPAG